MDFVAEFFAAIANSVVANLFMLAAILKIRSRRTFQSTLRSFPISRRLIAVLSVFIPLVEIATAMGLFLGTPYANVMAIGLLVVFSAAVQHAVSRRLNVPCNCFGETSGRMSANTIWRNGALVVLATPGLFLPAQFSLLNWLGSVFVVLFAAIVLQFRLNIKNSARLTVAGNVL